MVCTFTPFLGGGCLIDARLLPSLAFCIRYYNYTTSRARGMATLRFELRVEIGPQQRSNVPGLQRLARHAHQVLAQWGAPIRPDSSISQLLWRSDVVLHRHRGGEILRAGGPLPDPSLRTTQYPIDAEVRPKCRAPICDRTRERNMALRATCCTFPYKVGCPSTVRY